MAVAALKIFKQLKEESLANWLQCDGGYERKLIINLLFLT